MSSTLGLTGAQVEQAIAAAGLAPSLYDTQPWRFRIEPDLIELHADQTRHLPAVDPDGRELRLSCGAALFNLRIALQGLGIRPLVTILPDGLAHHPDRGSDALAVIRHGGRASATPELLRSLAAGSAARIGTFEDAPVSPAQQLSLARAVETERSWLHVVAEPTDRAVLNSLVCQAREAQLTDAGVRAEIAAWAGNHGDDPAADIPAQPSASAPERSRPDAADRSRGTEFRASNWADPFVVMVCSFHSGPAGELQSGQALQRLRLTASTLGLVVTTLSEPLAVPDLRAELRRKLATPLHPHAILRLGIGMPAPQPPRRPVADLVLAEPARSR